jgi:hypothetical protein
MGHSVQGLGPISCLRPTACITSVAQVCEDCSSQQAATAATAAAQGAPSCARPAPPTDSPVNAWRAWAQVPNSSRAARRTKAFISMSRVRGKRVETLDTLFKQRQATCFVWGQEGRG